MSHTRRAYAVASRLARLNYPSPRVLVASSSQCPSHSQAWRSFATGAGPSTATEYADLNEARRSKPQFGLRDSEASASSSVVREAERTPNYAPREPPAKPGRSYPSPGETAEIDSVKAWTKVGLPRDVIDRLLELYPECRAPTPAQLAFLLAVQKGDVDIYLKDYMGRGKTFSLVLAALAIVNRDGPIKGRVVMMLPTPHLAKQIEDLLRALGGESASVATITASDETVNMNARVILGTPSALLALAARKRNMTLGDRLKGVTHVFVDEIDTQLGPLPSRYAGAKQVKRHRSRLHPPQVALALDSLYGIVAERDGYDFSGRNNRIRSVFSSATLDNHTRRHIYGRGWVKPKGDSAVKSVVDLDFTLAATPRQVALRDTMGEIAQRAGAVALEPSQRKPRHYAFVVDPKGKLAPLDLESQSGGLDDEAFVPPAIDEDGDLVDLDELGAKKKGKKAKKDEKKPAMPVTLLEALAYLHTTVPPPAGTYSLAVLPDGASITAATEELETLGLMVLPLVPEVLAGGVSPPALDAPHIVLLTTRAAVPGLHLPHLHSIYLLNGLDVSKLSRQAKLAGGREGQSTAYSIITGRLGRFTTEVFDVSNPQRVVSIVPYDSYEEWALRHLFADKYHKWEFALSTWPGKLL